MLVIGHELPGIYQEEAPWSDEADHLLGEVVLPYPYFCAGACPGKVAEEEVPAIVTARPRGKEMASYTEAVRRARIDASLMPVFPADMQAAFIHDAENFALLTRAACTGRDHSSRPELQVNSQ
jgi:hypothetical protein